jgi:predicted polyphosphate/ATP-dependent NAD kinase
MEKIESVCILTNPFAKRNISKENEIEKIVKRYNGYDKNIKVMHFFIYDQNSVLNIFKHVGNVDLLVINGGDGTVKFILSVLFQNKPFKKMPLIAVLPSGSTNLIALDVGAINNKKNALKRFLHYLIVHKAYWKTSERPIVHIKMPSNKIDEYGLFVGMSLIYKASDYFNKRLKKHGLGGVVGIAITIIRTIYALFTRSKYYTKGEVVTCKLDNNRKITFSSLIFVITSLRKLMFGNKNLLSLGNFSYDDLHSLILIEKPKYFFINIVSFFMGKLSKHFSEENGYMLLHSKKFELTGVKGLAIDGETYELAKSTDTLIIESGELLKFVVFI